ICIATASAGSWTGSITPSPSVSLSSSRHLSRQPHAREDLAALRVVPVAKRRARDAPVSGPRPAAQNQVIPAEEDLGVLAIGIRDEPRIAAEATARPLPHLARSRQLVRGRRPLPLRLRRESRAMRAGEG